MYHTRMVNHHIIRQALNIQSERQSKNMVQTIDGTVSAGICGKGIFIISEVK